MKKTLTDKQKKIIDIVVLVLQIVVVILAITVSAIVLANPNVGSATVGKGNIKLLPVLTDSMNGSDEFYAEHTEWKGFKKGDLVVAKAPKDGAKDLKVGDVITFKMNNASTNYTDILVTHRIVEAGVDASGRTYYYTQGDANRDRDEKVLFSGDVLAVYNYNLKGVGAAINWLQTPKYFLLVIVLPLVLLFVYNIVLFVQMIIQAKVAKANENKGDAAAVAMDEEAIKRKAIEDYLASQEATKPDEEKSDN